MNLRDIGKSNLALLLAPLIYKHYPIGLQPPRLYFWLDALYKTKNLTGSVVEIGVSRGGTTAFSFKFLRQMGSDREYVALDTFGGFPKEQFAQDVKLGNDWKNFRSFSANSLSIFRKVLKLHDVTGVQTVQADISKVDPAKMPARISACLLDVDLAIPIYDGLKLVWPRLEEGGVIVIDDCYNDNDGDWQAIVGYRKFCQEMGQPENFFHGVAYLSKDQKVLSSFPSSAALKSREVAA